MALLYQLSLAMYKCCTARQLRGVAAMAYNCSQHYKQENM